MTEPNDMKQVEKRKEAFTKQNEERGCTLDGTRCD